MKGIRKQFSLVLLIIFMSLFGIKDIAWAEQTDNMKVTKDIFVMSDNVYIGIWHRLEGNGEVKWLYSELGNGGLYVTNSWRLINNKWYHFDSEGWMQTGWLQEGEDWYYLDDLNGHMIADEWRMAGNNWYYLGSNGKMLKDCVTPDGYSVDKSGAWIEENEIRTWDKLNYPDVYGPTEWPQDLPEGDDYIKRNNDNTLKISKYYQFRDVKNNVYSLDYYTTTCAPHRVYIMDEIEGNGFKLIDWFESKDDWLPQDGGDPDDYPYEQVKKQHFNTGITGTEEKLPHIIPADTETKVLHILLEYAGKPE